jgi:hypothetical protein
LRQSLSERSRARHSPVRFSRYPDDDTGACDPRASVTPSRSQADAKMSMASEFDEPRSIAAEALRLAQTLPDPELAAILREIAVIFGETAAAD